MSEEELRAAAANDPFWKAVEEDPDQYMLSEVPRTIQYSRPLVHHNRRNYIISRQANSWVRGVPGWLLRKHGGTYKPGKYVLPRDTRSFPRYNPQETINMVKSSLLKTEKGRNVLRRAREIAFGESYNPTRRELERAENAHLFDLGYLNKRLVDWKAQMVDARDTATDSMITRQREALSESTGIQFNDPEFVKRPDEGRGELPEGGGNLQEDMEGLQERLRLHQDKLKKFREDLSEVHFNDPEFVHDAELYPNAEIYQRRIQPTFDARRRYRLTKATYDALRRYRLTKAQRNLPREAWGTDMDIPEENWNKKMRKARLEAGIGTQQFPTLRVEDIK